MVCNSRNLAHLGCNYLIRHTYMCLFIIPITQAVPVRTLNDATNYLSKFGYLPYKAHNFRLIEYGTWKKAVEDFQSFGGLNVTGDLNGETLELMSQPRCGVRDKNVFDPDSDSEIYSRWPNKSLNYRILEFPESMNHHNLIAQVERAFAVWSQVTDLTFTRKEKGPVHIKIRRHHSDAHPFAYDTRILAHAFLPGACYQGEVHFNLDKLEGPVGSWNGPLLYVAAHEFGHTLGLKHSNVGAALMSPFYHRLNREPMLDYDDVEAIRTLYGERTDG